MIKILLVEDNNVNRLLISHMLKRKNWEITEALNGVEACELVSGSDFDIIIMDLQMPEMDGFEAARKIREIESKLDKRIPIIILTAFANEFNEKFKNSGLTDAYLTKPVNQDVLYDLIYKLTGKS